MPFDAQALAQQGTAECTPGRDWERECSIMRANYEGVRDAYESYKSDEKARWEKQTKELRHQKQEALHEAQMLRTVLDSAQKQQARDQRIIDALTDSVTALARGYR